MSTDGIPKHLSPTSIDRWRVCPRRFYFQDVKQLPVEEVYSYERTLGIVVHKALETLMRYQPSGRGDEAQARVVDWSLLRTCSTKAVDAEDLERLRTDGLRLVRRYFEEPSAQSAWPLKVETTFQLRLTNGTVIRTRVDRVDRNEHGLLEIIDYKTGRNSIDEHDLAYETAPIVQLLAVSKASEIQVEKVTWIYLRRGESVSWWPEEDDVEAATDRLLSLLRKLHREQDFEPNPGGHCVSCPFSGICPAWASESGGSGEEAGNGSADEGSADYGSADKAA